MTHPNDPNGPSASNHDLGYCEGVEHCDECYAVYNRYAHKAVFQPDSLCEWCGGTGAYIWQDAVLCLPCIEDAVRECEPW